MASQRYLGALEGLSIGSSLGGLVS